MWSAVSARIASTMAQLRPSERKVAQAVLDDPEGTVQRTMAALAATAGVSEPTVVRFCRALGCDGYGQFRVELARALGAGKPYVHKAVDFDDDVPTQVEKVLGSTAQGLATLGAQLDRAALARAIDLLAAARRIEFYGSGSSGLVAADAQGKFFRLAVPSVAYADPHQQAIAAAALAEGDCLVVFSQTGRTRDLARVAASAHDGGAAVIAVTRAGSPVARAATLTIAVPDVEDPDLYTPMVSRIVQLAVVDMLAIGVAMRRGPEFVAHLKRLHDSLAGLRFPREPQRTPKRSRASGRKVVPAPGSRGTTK